MNNDYSFIILCLALITIFASLIAIAFFSIKSIDYFSTKERIELNPIVHLEKIDLYVEFIFQTYFYEQVTERLIRKEKIDEEEIDNLITVASNKIISAIPLEILLDLKACFRDEPAFERFLLDSVIHNVRKRIKGI